MARRKQMSPMQRIPSGEVMESLANGQATIKQTGNAREAAFQWSNGAIAKSKKTTFGSTGAGTIQLVICVAGIYASLYAPATHVEDLDTHLLTTVYPGLSYRSASPKPPTRATLPYPSLPTRLASISAFQLF
jgi:hypothetical protein